MYDDPSHTSVTLDGVGGTTVTNVAAGAVDAASTDAVNGSQLFATNQDVAANTADITALDGRVTTNAGDIATNTGDIAAIDGRVTLNEADITALQDTAVTYDDATQA